MMIMLIMMMMMIMIITITIFRMKMTQGLHLWLALLCATLCLIRFFIMIKLMMSNTMMISDDDLSSMIGHDDASDQEGSNDSSVEDEEINTGVPK